jgi:branched-chain amino acid transport system permease protein
MNRPTHQPMIWMLAAALALAVLPFLLGANAIDKLTTLFIFMLLASTWGLLAGQAGLVSVGQQAFFGLGAYFALRLVDGGWTAYPALFAGAIGAAVVAWGLSFFVLRLKEGEFAIATWVIAEVIRILVMLDPLVQGETGTSLIALNAVEPELRRNYGFWMALGSLVFMLGVTAWLLRSAVGTATRAIGEDDEAAASLGVRVTPTRRWVYVLASLGAALAGVAWLASAITFLPRTNFGVQWSVLMLFMALVGGLRSQWGPLVGALLLFVLQESLGHLGAWYLAGLGAVAMVFALWLPRGLAGVWDDWQARRSASAQPPLAPTSVSSSPSLNPVPRSSTP